MPLQVEDYKGIRGFLLAVPTHSMPEGKARCMNSLAHQQLQVLTYTCSIKQFLDMHLLWTN